MMMFLAAHFTQFQFLFSKKSIVFLRVICRALKFRNALRGQQSAEGTVAKLIWI